MNILKRIINFSTADLKQLQKAVWVEIERRRSLTAELDGDEGKEDLPRLVIAATPPEKENEPDSTPRKRRKPKAA